MPNKNSNEQIEVGKEILSYCGKCKEDSTHVISVMGDGKISKVMCRMCNAQHNYRKPKSLAGDKTKTSKSRKTTSARKAQSKPAKTWNNLIEGYDLNNAQDYNMKQNHEESSLIRHSSFGIGVITKKISETKIEVQFEVGSKLLVINKG